MKLEEIINKIHNADCLDFMKKMPSESIDSIITSPPYYLLRDYGVDGQIGLETTYKEYINKLCDIFVEVKRILKKEGTCFVNLGDSFSGSGKGRNGDGTAGKSGTLNKNNKGSQEGVIFSNKRQLPAKSLMMIPERFGIAMIDNNWILRNKLVWIKRNAMPESVQDRWKKAHEYIFFFVKNKKYYFNLDEIRTPHKYEQGRNALGLNPSSMGEKYNRDKKDRIEKFSSMPARTVKLNPKGACPPDFFDVNTNCRRDDTVKEHYATYPQDLIIPLIKAGCPAGGIILDPFMGAGTTAVVAKKLDRNFIGIELNESYIDIANKRIKAIQPKLPFLKQKREAIDL